MFECEFKMYSWLQAYLIYYIIIVVEEEKKVYRYI